ncbi:MAG TPA: D-alanyl-D-alanine carboxypeptidase/D-alanyl-D-alanine-endopeptidase [Actinophytocola sp.]|nr:D-alanyl-D-alanine carboxypeptidase/D-alanyl-D-alanine-endopeptidase [Actinophytocola sp.]
MEKPPDRGPRPGKPGERPVWPDPSRPDSPGARTTWPDPADRREATDTRPDEWRVDSPADQRGQTATKPDEPPADRRGSKGTKPGDSATDAKPRDGGATDTKPRDGATGTKSDERTRPDSPTDRGGVGTKPGDRRTDTKPDGRRSDTRPDERRARPDGLDNRRTETKPDERRRQPEDRRGDVAERRDERRGDPVGRHGTTAERDTTDERRGDLDGRHGTTDARRRTPDERRGDTAERRDTTDKRRDTTDERGDPDGRHSTKEDRRGQHEDRREDRRDQDGQRDDLDDQPSDTRDRRTDPPPTRPGRDRTRPESARPAPGRSRPDSTGGRHAIHPPTDPQRGTRPDQPRPPRRAEPHTPPTGYRGQATQFLRPLEPPRNTQSEATQFLELPKMWPNGRPDAQPNGRPGTRNGGTAYADPGTVYIEPAPKPQRPAPEKLAPPTEKRKKKTLLITTIAVVAVLALAAGAVFAIPGLSAKLGLTSAEDDVAIAPPAPPVSFQPGLHAPGTDAPAPTPDGVRAALTGPTSAGELGTLTGVVYDPMTKQTLWENNPTTPLVPASTGKLLTSAAALLSLDHTEQLSTKVVEGDQPGDVVIVGGGDPTLSSLKPGTESVYPGAAHLSDLVDQVKKSGAEVNTVHVDLSRYEGDSMAPGWSNADIGGGYIAPMVPAMLDGARADANAQDGARNSNPARQLAQEFATRIGATVADGADTKVKEGAKVLGEVKSAPLVELVDTLLHSSDNVLAEAVAREVAKGRGEEVSFAGASKATMDILRENKFDLEGVTMHDGSGLSTEDRVPARLFGELLGLAAGPDGKDARTAKLRPLIGALPVAGGTGTLGKRFGGVGAEGRGWVRAKTGTLSGVNSLAGVVLDKDNRLLVFALMSNGGGATAVVRDKLDVVAATLRGCGCR